MHNNQITNNMLQLKAFFANRFVAYDSKLAKLFNVDIICILGMVFTMSEMSVYTDNKIKVARQQYLIDSLFIYALCLLISGILAQLHVQFAWSTNVLVWLVLLAFGYSIIYAITACISKYKANCAGFYDDAYWCSHYKLDQIRYMYKIPESKTYVSHYEMLGKCLSLGLKYKKQGWFIKIC